MHNIEKQHHATTMSNEAPYSRQALKQAYAIFAFNKRPTVLLTLTVKEPKGKYGNGLVSENTLLNKANLLLKWVNADLYGRKFLKNGKGLQGFGSIEKQSNGQPHTHLAITSPVPPKQFLKLKKSLFEKIKKIDLFEASGTDVRMIDTGDVDYWRVGGYIAKEGRMVTLGAEGIQ